MTKSQQYKDKLKEYGSEEDVITRNKKAYNKCSCGHNAEVQIYSCWGEIILCTYCGKVTAEGIQDAMSGASGNLFVHVYVNAV